MVWELPTEEDMMTCAGCGRQDCDSECQAYYELEAKALEDEARGIFLPLFCNRKICTKCGVDWPDESPVCNACEVSL